MRATFFLGSLALLLICFVYSCGPGADYAPNETIVESAFDEAEMDENEGETYEEEAVFDEEEPIVGGRPDEEKLEVIIMDEPNMFPPPDEGEPTIQEERLKSKNYKAVLAADSVIDGERKGTMTVYIGELEAVDARIKEIKNKPASEKSVIGTTSIANTGEYVRITPDSSHFHVHPKVSECLPIRPIASQKFSLTPKERCGVFAVSAQIEIFEDKDCSCMKNSIGTNEERITVKITVVPLLDNLYFIFKQNLETFFGSLLALLAAIALFKIRKKAKMDDKKTE